MDDSPNPSPQTPLQGSPLAPQPSMPPLPIETPPQDFEEPTKEPKKEGLKSVLYTLSIIIIAPILAILMTMYVFQSYQVDGPSMENTLHNGDRLIVLKLPKTWASVTHRKYLPSRSEIIIFTKSGIDDQTSEKQLVKRVIGMPGDRVVVRDGGVTVFNSDNPSGFNPDSTQDYSIKENFTEGNVDITVPVDKVFVMGDNRGNSLDSRAFGPIPTSDIVGKLALRIFPISDIQRF